jgi:hypothetical protein
MNMPQGALVLDAIDAWIYLIDELIAEYHDIFRSNITSLAMTISAQERA